MFDNYTLKARFYPVVILFMPLILLGIIYAFEFKTPLHVFTSLGIVGALTYLFSQLGRDRGKIKEPLLWYSWGGPPTTQILRLSNKSIDVHTKKRYHSKLQIECPVTLVPDAAMEASRPDQADEVYRAWTRYLIAQTRDTKVFPLLFKDNVSYGFRRNLWALKSIGLLLTSALLIGNYLFWWYRSKTWNLALFPENFLYATALLLIVLLFWLFIIRASWVKITAFSYAERLCETTEIL
ncbi:MAG: hypothetical protein Q8K66_13505 [Sediminibacterium sp.]|nr:hypothetical protein [Sediminibacterium sp.]MDP3129203.1 hypothetical protein [Sediminibacterium sp.]